MGERGEGREVGGLRGLGGGKGTASVCVSLTHSALERGHEFRDLLFGFVVFVLLSCQGTVYGDGLNGQYVCLF